MAGFQARIGDYSMGHWVDIFYFPPTPLKTGSPDTFSCGFLPTSRVTDTAEKHFAWIFGLIPLPSYYHNPEASVGAPTTFINLLQAFRTDDKYDCGDTQAEGCPTHIVGDS